MYNFSILYAKYNCVKIILKNYVISEKKKLFSYFEIREVFFNKRLIFKIKAINQVFILLNK